MAQTGRRRCGPEDVDLEPAWSKRSTCVCRIAAPTARSVSTATGRAPELPAGAQREAPAIDTECHEDDDGGFVDDPHGINLEAVCHHPEDEADSSSR